jgi:CIC family chloride channel protein
MPARFTASIVINIRKIIRTLETSFFIIKETVSERNFIYLASVIVAISCALAVILLKSFSHNVFKIANYINTYLKLPYANSIFPIIGILLTVFVIRNFLKGDIEKGSSKILFAVAKKGGIMPRKQMYAQIVTSSLTVGLGGSAGLESPITITGAAFGSNFAQTYKLSQKDRILLLACGVAAGISAAFNAPIAGVLFAIEVVLTDVAISAFIPIIISAATGALISQLILSEDILLKFKNIQEFDSHNTFYYVLLGILAGLISVYHARTFRRIEHFFSKFKTNSYKKAFIGAVVLAFLIFLFPTLFGEGYESIKWLSSQPEKVLENSLFENLGNPNLVLLLFTGVVVLLKSIATGLTLGSGGNGGNFAPSLFVGSYLGFFVAKSINTLFNTNLPITNFTMVGMAGILSGLFHAPLTAIFLIGEITSGYELMIPLMIVSSISFAVTKQLDKHSMDVKMLAEKGQVFTGDKDRNILLSIDFLKLIKTQSNSISLDSNLETLIEKLTSTNSQVFAVVDEKNNYLGLVDFDEIKPLLFNSFRIKYTKVEDVVTQTETVNYDDGMELIMDKFESSKKEVLPVLKSNKFMGFISKLDILEAYRKRVKEMVIE